MRPARATATFLFRQFFLTVPEELAEAARIDGAGPLRFFGHILLPLSRTNIAALFAMLFVFLLLAARKGLAMRTRQTALMLAAAGVVVVLLLPIGGTLGQSLATLAGWTMDVPIGGVFRGLLIGVATLTAVHAARMLLTVEGADD